MKSTFFFVVTVVLATLFTSFAQDPCQALYSGNEAGCLGNQTCVWCKCAAVPSTCVTVQDSRRLPPGVFTCANSSADCGKYSTNATCAGMGVGCSWCTISSSNLRTSTLSSSACVDFRTASHLPKGSCTGPY